MVLLIGLFIGMVLGLTGAGGSVLAVPMLILFLGVSATDAMGVALGAVAASAAYGVILQRKNVLWVPALALALGGMLTAPLGKYVALMVADLYLLIAFSALAFFIALRMWRQATLNPEQTQVLRAGHSPGDNAPLLCRLSTTGQFQLRPKCISGLIVGGLVIGFVSGLLGVGGGFLIIPVLLFLSQISMARAVASSLLAIALISSSGFISHLILKGIPTEVSLLHILLASLVGMLLSQWLSRFIAGPMLQKTFAITLILISVVTVIQAIL